MYLPEQIDPYRDEISELAFDDFVPYLKGKKDSKDFRALAEYLCSVLLDFWQKSFYTYKPETMRDMPNYQAYLEMTGMLGEDDMPYYHAVAAFSKGKNKQALRLVKQALENLAQSGNTFDEDWLVFFLGPFKAGFPELWGAIREFLSEHSKERGILELCDAIRLLHTGADDDQIMDALDKALAANPDSVAAKTYLAQIYCWLGRWGNSVALFEQVADVQQIFFMDDVYFSMGWCYGKLRESANEIEAYEKAAKISPLAENTVNNLGYAYYKTKQYQKALRAFQFCMDNGVALRYATNNYVRTLLAMRQYKDAKDFVKNAPHRISKDLLDKVSKAENTNGRITEDKAVFRQEGAAFREEGIAVEGRKAADAAKRQQFASEKILEEELVLRMNAGLEVFGNRLRVYRRKGIYGRQHTLSNGRRPDIIAEDERGNLYVIELKKDAGYSDAYDQIVDYLDWFDANGNAPAVYGIICLNSPTRELLDKVHGNERVRVFEYQISYTER